MRDPLEEKDHPELFRQFVTRRPWLHGNGRLLSTADYSSLKYRDNKFWSNLSNERKMYLRGFMDGWKEAK